MLTNLQKRGSHLGEDLAFYGSFKEEVRGHCTTSQAKQNKLQITAPVYLNTGSSQFLSFFICTKKY